MLLARHYLDVERPQAALDALGRVPGDELEDPEYWVIRAHALLQLERSEESVEAARSGLAIDPEDIELLTVLALAEGQQGRYGEAHAALDTGEKPLAAAHRALRARALADAAVHARVARDRA
jgi:Flp pilus assembly protein TadD